MAYNPSVNDRSGEILAGYQMQAADMRLAQQQQQAESFANIGTALTGAITKAQENKMTSEYLDQMAGQFANTPGMDGQTPLMSQEELDKFSKMSLSAKQGMIVPKQAMFEQSLKNTFVAAQIQGFGQRNAIQNQVPQNQQPYPSPAAQPQGNPAGNINMDFVQ
jgi:predicted exporter